MSSAAGASQPLLQADLVIRNTSAVACVSGPGDAGVVPGGAVAVGAGQVLWVGPEAELGGAVAIRADAEELDARGGLVTPGLIDPHTHLIFAGERSEEFALRWQGTPYLEILARGGGILSTVRATRQASDEELLAAARARLQRMLAHGVTTVEIKTGYGLSTEQELRLLRLIRQLQGQVPQRLSPTLLAAHALPPEHAERRDDYLQAILEEMLPVAAAEGLCDAVDVFLEQGAFTAPEAERLGQAAAAAGLAVTQHAGQFTDQGGPEMCARLGARSCDHLEQVSEAGMAAMARAGVPAVLLPGAMLSVNLPVPPARRLLEVGVPVALGTDCNPGSSMTESLPLMMFLAVTRMGMTCEEALAGVTRQAARVLRRPDLGHLSPGARADLAIFDARSHRTLAYHFGSPLAKAVIVGGRIAFVSGL
jgi:imidazolonepropionase